MQRTHSGTTQNADRTTETTCSRFSAGQPVDELKSALRRVASLSCTAQHFTLYLNMMGCHRNNTFSGITYMDDWAIFGYDLFNEPRCPASQMTAPCTQRITDWADTMYAFARSHNKKQLVWPATYSCIPVLSRQLFPFESHKNCPMV